MVVREPPAPHLLGIVMRRVFAPLEVTEDRGMVLPDEHQPRLEIAIGVRRGRP